MPKLSMAVPPDDFSSVKNFFFTLRTMHSLSVGEENQSFSSLTLLFCYFNVFRIYNSNRIVVFIDKSYLIKLGLGDSCLVLANLGFLVIVKLNFDLYL